MNKRPRNHSIIFDLFYSDNPDKTGNTLLNIGKVSFGISFVGLIISNIAPSESKLHDWIITITGLGFLNGLLMFVALGIRSGSKDNSGATFLGSTRRVLRNTFLYLFLPAIIITAILVIWAIMTKQPAFR